MSTGLLNTYVNLCTSSAGQTFRQGNITHII